MAVLFAYFLVVLIWATTPLAIQWSSHSLTFIAAVLVRMLMALVLGLLVNVLFSRRLFSHPRAWQVYLAGAIGIFPNMPVVYWSAQYIPSGVVAVIFAMSPFVTGLMTWLMLKQNPFTLRRVIALALAVVGLIVIFHQQMQLGSHAVYGILGILSSCIMFSFSAVLVKKVGVALDAFNQAIGTLLFAAPGLLLMWLLMDGHIPQTVSMKSLLSVGYLAILGSLVGATLFFYVLHHMSASAVSLITLMTPVLALLLGGWIGNESLSVSLWIGAGFVVVALLIYTEVLGRLAVAAVSWSLAALKRDAWHVDLLDEVKSDYHRFK